MCVCVYICTHTHTHTHIYIYIFFNPVNPELNYSNFEYLNIPGKVLNVNEFTEQILFQEKEQYSVTLG